MEKGCKVAGESAIIGLEEARKNYEMAEKNMLLSHYCFPEKPGADGIYRIWVKDDSRTDGRRQISSNSLEKLKDKVYRHEKGVLDSCRKTFSDVFESVEENKVKYVKGDRLSSRMNTVNRDRQFYERFFAGTPFESRFIDEITKKDIEAVVFSNLKRYDLRKKAFYSLRGLIKSVFQLAYEESWIKDNVFTRVNFSKFEAMLKNESDIKERVHSEEDLRRILEEARRHEASRPSYMPAYALELQILLGCRPGEVTPLRKDDVSASSIAISREQLNIRKYGDKPTHNEVVDHTKNYLRREIPRFGSLDDFLERLYEALDRYYPGTDVLFPDPGNETGVISGYALYGYYRRICRKLGIRLCRDHMKGTHSFRRNATTDIINLSNGNAALESSLIGHSPEVARKHYFTGIDMMGAAEVLNRRNLA